MTPRTAFEAGSDALVFHVVTALGRAAAEEPHEAPAPTTASTVPAERK